MAEPASDAPVDPAAVPANGGAPASATTGAAAGATAGAPAADTARPQTFFTSIDEPKAAKQGKKKDTYRALEATTAGPRILNHHEGLRNLATTLDHRMAALLNEHEKDFFLAYKTHMYTVQREIKTLQMKADHEEAKTREDTTIKALEGELDWFMTEALRLDELCKGYKKEVDKWRQKAEASDEDRRFLEDQIKGAKRQNKILRAAAERARSSAYTALMVTKARSEQQPLQPGAAQEGLPAVEDGPRMPGRPLSAGGSGANAALALAPRYETPEPVQRSSGQGSAGALAVLSAAAGGGASSGQLGYPPAAGTLATASHHGASAASLAQSVLGNDAEERYIEAIQHLKESIIREQHTVRMLQASRSTQYAKKSEMEEFFLKCVDEARKDLIKRRHMTMYREKSEKEQMLEAMLNNEDVLVCLYEKLFPHRTGMARSLDAVAMSEATEARPSYGQAPVAVR